MNEDNKNYESSKMHAETLLNSLSTETLKSRGVKMAPFFILKKSNSPAVTLELGFLSNENDRKYITSDEGQNEIASKIYNHVSK
ncbi:N-acetylmuramoyl-L-alanine amidase [compost metagenome]